MESFTCYPVIAFLQQQPLDNVVDDSFFRGLPEKRRERDPSPQHNMVDNFYSSQGRQNQSGFHCGTL